LPELTTELSHLPRKKTGRRKRGKGVTISVGGSAVIGKKQGWTNPGTVGCQQPGENRRKKTKRKNPPGNTTCQPRKETTLGSNFVTRTNPTHTSDLVGRKKPGRAARHFHVKGGPTKKTVKKGNRY